MSVPVSCLSGSCPSDKVTVTKGHTPFSFEGGLDWPWDFSSNYNRARIKKETRLHDQKLFGIFKLEAFFSDTIEATLFTHITRST